LRDADGIGDAADFRLLERRKTDAVALAQAARQLALAAAAPVLRLEQPVRIAAIGASDRRQEGVELAPDVPIADQTDAGDAFRPVIGLPFLPAGARCRARPSASGPEARQTQGLSGSEARNCEPFPRIVTKIPGTAVSRACLTGDQAATESGAAASEAGVSG
jgi:hypothetical protein